MLFSCIAFLSRLPIPQSWQESDQEKFANVANYFPSAGLVIGSVNGLVAAALAALITDNLAIATLVVLQIFISGAFHEDGFADLADAMGAYNRERRFEIMRDSRLGTFGVCAIAAIFLIRWNGYLSIHQFYGASHLFVSLVLIGAWSRWTSITFLNFLPYLHPSGKGIAKGFKKPNALNSIVTLSVLLLITSVFNWKWGLLFSVSTCLSMLGSYLAFKRLFKGINGDCLGALTIIQELLTLVLMGALIG